MARRKYHKRSRHKAAMKESPTTPGKRSGRINAIKGLNENYQQNDLTCASELLPQQCSPESVLFEAQQSELLGYNSLSPEIGRTFPRLKDDLNSSDDEIGGHRSTSPLLLQSKSNSASKFDSWSYTGAKELEVDSASHSMSNFFPLDKTLSMNDELKLEMNNCETLARGESLINRISDSRNFDINFQCTESEYKLSYRYGSGSNRFNSLDPNGESQNEQHFQDYLDKLPPQMSNHEISDESDNKSKIFPNEWSCSEQQEIKFEAQSKKALQETTTNRLSTNWDDCRRIFSNLRRLNSLKLRGLTNEYPTKNSSKYRKIPNETPLSNSASSISSTPPTPSCNCLDNRRSKRPLAESVITNDKDTSDNEYSEDKNMSEETRAGSTTPCSGRQPPTKRCRTTLNFDGEEFRKLELPGISDPVTDLNLIQRKQDKDGTLYQDSTGTTKEPWSNGTPESIAISIIDLPAISDSGGCNGSSPNVEHNTIQNHQQPFVESASRRGSLQFRIITGPILKAIAFCAWLGKKVLQLLKKVHKK